MIRRSLLLILTAIGLALGILVLLRDNQRSTQNKNQASVARAENSQKMGAGSDVPAHYEALPSADELTPTLPPEKFTAQTRAAYQAAREIPQTMAQMPCYCHCDRGMGHRSLHSCFEDDHAAHCATCVDEALLAYELQKRGLSPKQIREQIIAQFGD